MNAIIAPTLAVIMTATFGKKLLEKLEQFPISLVDRKGCADPIQTDASDGRLTVGFASDSLFAEGNRLPFMFCHELGHAAAATEAEFTQPNLGLPNTENTHGTLTPRITEAELEALAFQAALIESCGGNPARDNMLRLCEPLFKVNRSRLQAAYDSPDYSWDSWTRRINRNLGKTTTSTVG